MWFLVGCDPPYSWTPTPCPGWDELVVTDPDGVATADELEDADATISAFAGWVGTDVCVGEVRFVVEANEEHPEVAGWYGSRRDLVVVEGGTDVTRVVTHELCHAWDDVAGFSTTYADLMSPCWCDEELYPTEEKRRAEAFAQYCEGGPMPRALSIAAEEACGAGDVLDAVMRDEVFPGYEEEIPIEVGGSVTLVPLEVPSLGDVTWVDLAQADGGVALLYDSGLSILDLGALVWSEPVAVHVRSAALVATVGGAHAVVTDDVTLLELVEGDLVDPGMTWLPVLLDETTVGTTTTLTLDPDRAVWQVWGDGEPLQHRERAGGEATPVPGDEGLVLSPTTTMLPEGQLVWHYASLAPSPVAYALTDGVAPAAVPPGVVPVATLPGGEVLATGYIFPADVWRETVWLLRSADGEWQFPQANCEGLDIGSVYAAGGGRVVSLGWDGGLTLDEVVID